MCPVCYAVNGYRPAVSRARHRSRPAVALTGAALIARASGAGVAVAGAWLDLGLGSLPHACALVLYGPPGSGKSTLAVALAAGWPAPSVVLSYEMGTGHALVEIARRQEAYAVVFASVGSFTEAVEVIEAGYDLVVVDSVQASDVDAADWVYEVVPRGRALLLTSQVNAAGEVRGGLAASHVADVVIELPEYGRFEVHKNRFGPLAAGRWA